MAFRSHIAFTAIAALGLTAGHARAQVIGSFDNFDVFNDTGQTAEGFEIDVEDVAPADLTREFPVELRTGLADPLWSADCLGL